MGPVKILALRYATRTASRRAFFYDQLDDESATFGMDYFIWVVRTPSGIVVVDTGCKEDVCVRRGRSYLASPAALVTDAGIDPAEVGSVVLTHFHNDHIGCVDAFPNATFYVQSREMAFWTGPAAGEPLFSRIVEVDDMTRLVSLNLQGQVKQLSGDYQLTPEIRLYWVGGHTPGTQVVAVSLDAGGPVVLAADACHYYENLTENRPALSSWSLPETYAAFHRIRDILGDSGVLVPGHDPLVMTRFDGLPGRMAGRGVEVV